MKHYISIFILATLLSACTSGFNPDIEESPVVVINMLATPDSLLRASVTRSWQHTLLNKPDVRLRDAEVVVSVNGAPAKAMTYDSDRGDFFIDYRPSQGDRIEISAFSREYGSASGVTVIPEAVKIDDWSFTAMRVTDYDGIIVEDSTLSYLPRLEIRYSITFTDPADQENYYLLSGKPYFEFGGGVSSDPILGENDSPLDAIFSKGKYFIVFSDRSINGKSYTLSYTTSYIPFVPVTELAKGRITDRISLCSISRDYYLYMLSIYKKYGDLNNNLEDIGLMEPKLIYSNVEQGCGIIASQSSDTINNDVHDLVLRFAGIIP